MSSRPEDDRILFWITQHKKQFENDRFKTEVKLRKMGENETFEQPKSGVLLSANMVREIFVFIAQTYQQETGRALFDADDALKYLTEKLEEIKKARPDLESAKNN